MIPIVTPDEMAAIDAAAPEPLDVLIDRAAAAVARRAVVMLGGTYGRRVVVIAGKGNNGNDGRAAALRLRARGAQVTVFDASSAPSPLPSCDLVIDAAYGTGLRRAYAAPLLGAPRPLVLAVDIVSGVDGLTGHARGVLMRADCTVTFAALKPGVLLGDGPALCGATEVADLGLDVSRARAHLVEASDVARWVPPRAIDTHKWRAAVWVVGGSIGMAGAARLACGGAMRAGAGYVRLSVPGGHDPGAPTEVVQVAMATDLVIDAAEAARFGAFVVGPGLGRDAAMGHSLASFVLGLGRPVVLDGDALTLLGSAGAEVLAGRTHSTVLTPHDREFRDLAGVEAGADRMASARALAARCNATVLLKGPTTIVADPMGKVLVSTTGDQRLATAGTGDVLAGIVGALLARGIEPLRAAAAAAYLHGVAAQRAPREAMIASDLLTHLPAVLSSPGDA